MCTSGFDYFAIATIEGTTVSHRLQEVGAHQGSNQTWRRMQTSVAGSDVEAAASDGAVEGMEGAARASSGSWLGASSTQQLLLAKGAKLESDICLLWGSGWAPV